MARRTRAKARAKGRRTQPLGRSTVGIIATVVLALAVLVLRSQADRLNAPSPQVDSPQVDSATSAPMSDAVATTGEITPGETTPVEITSGEIHPPSDLAVPTISASTTDEDDALARINGVRMKEGLPGLSAHPALMAAARDHSQDMADHQLCQHEGSDGADVDDRMHRSGYAPAAYAENLACGTSTPAGAVGEWLKSKPHRANLMDARFTDAGIGVAGAGSSRVWTLTLGKP
jgi:uncharacterized protein YkwD